MEEQDINYYVNWALYAILGRMNVADELLRRYKTSIHNVATYLQEKNNTKPKTLYRGVIIEPELLIDDELPYDDKLLFISFSEDQNVACWFADVDAIISGFVKIHRPNARGYFIKHNTTQDSILFHYAWGLNDFLIKAAKIHPDIDLVQFIWNIQTQNEVIIKPIKRSLKVIPISEIVCLDTKTLDEMFCCPGFS